MDLNYNAVSMVDTLGLVQGLILGSLLIFIGLKKSKPTLFLGLFVIIYALDLLPSILEDLEITKQYPQLILLPFDNTWLPFAMFFIYIQKISIFSHTKIKYNLLYPGLIVFGFQTVLFFLPATQKIKIDESLWYNLIELMGIIYSFWIMYITIKWIDRHISEVKNQYASITFKELKWARLFVIVSAVYLFLGIFINIYF